MVKTYVIQIIWLLGLRLRLGFLVDPLHSNMPSLDSAPAIMNSNQTPATTRPNTTVRTYANGAETPISSGPTLKPVPLATRPISYVDSTPLVVFSPVEVEQLKNTQKHIDYEVLGRKTKTS